MKRKTFLTVLIIEIVLCSAFLIMKSIVPDWFTTATAFPFEPIGALLRMLSLANAVGNVIAIILYALICLIPAGAYLLLRKKGKAGKVDLLLWLISAVLFFVLYYMINPGLFAVQIPGTSKMMLGMLFYSVFCCYLVLKILEKCMKADADWLEKGLRMILYLIVMVLVFEIIVGCFEEIAAAYQKAQTGNYGSDLFFTAPNLTMTYVFLALQSIVRVIPFALDILIIIGGMRLLDAMKIDKYSDESVAAAEKLAVICIRSLVITMLSGLGLNVLQVVLRNQINYVNLVISVPIFSIMFALAVLLLAKYIHETQKVKQELDMFI